MGTKSGDKSRHFRKRRKKLARRVKMREIFGDKSPKSPTAEGGGVDKSE